MVRMFVGAQSAWWRVPATVRLGAVVALLAALFLIVASPAFAAEYDPNPFRWKG